MSSTNGGSTAGKAEAGDTITVTFSEAISPASVPTSATIELSASPGNNKPVLLTIPGLSLGSGFQIGTTNSYLNKSSADASFTGSTFSQPSPAQVRVAIGTWEGLGTLTTGTAGPVALIPAGSLTDTAGNPAVGTLTLTILFF